MPSYGARAGVMRQNGLPINKVRVHQIIATIPMLKAHIQVKTRTSLAPHHLFAAARLVKRIDEVEQEYKGEPFGPFYDEILHNALGVAMMTVASLESYANELYFEGSAIVPALNRAFALEFQEIADREPVLRKFSLILAIRSAKRLDRSCPEVQSVDALIKLRNAIVHFRPEWFGEQDEHAKLSIRLRNMFVASPFLANEPLFPTAWASASFANWALRSTIQFLRYFYAEAGLEDPLQKFISRVESLAGENAL